MTRLILVLMLLLPAAALAQVPGSFHYQGRLTDLAGVPVDTATTGTVEMVFALFDSASATTAVWSDTFPAVDVDGGLFQVDLGPFAAGTADFSGPLWLQIMVDGDLLGGRLPLLAVPQALHAADASLVGGVSAASLEESAEISSEIANHAGDADAHHSSLSSGLGITPDSVAAVGAVSAGSVSTTGTVSAAGDVIATGALIAGNGAVITGDGTVSGDLLVDGNLGVGVVPIEPLDVAGAARFAGTVHLYGSNSGGYGDGFRMRSDGNYLGTNGDAIIFEKTDGNQSNPDGGVVFANMGSGGVSNPSMVIRGSGNVGIGTTTPASALHVVGPQLRLESSGNEATLVLNNTGAGGNGWLLRSTSNASGHGGGKLVFDLAGVDKATLLPSGRLGLGTTAPGRPLVVVGQNEDNLIRFQRSSGETTYGELISGTGGVAIAARNASSGAGLHFYASNGTANTEHMRITRGGRVGLGTTSPDARLHVEYAGTGIDAFRIDDVANDPTPFVVSQSGRVGIGTTNMSEKKVNIVWSSGNGSALHVEDTDTGSGTPETIRADVRAGGASNGQPVAVRGDSWHANPTAGAYGVVGYNRATNQTAGLSGAGMWGGSVGTANAPAQFNGQGHGVQGESYSTALGQAGVWGAALANTGRVYGVYGQTNSGGNQSAGVRGHVLANSGSNADGVRGSTLAGGTASYGVYSGGNFAASGTKSAVVYTDTQGPTELYAVEAADVWFEDVGEAELEGGAIFVPIDPLLAETLRIDEEHPIQVFVTPYADVDLYVERDLDGFTVRERSGGTTDAAFGWRLIAKRRHFEDRRLRAVPEHIDRHMRPDLSDEEIDALNARWGTPSLAEANGGGESLTTARAMGIEPPGDPEE